MSGFSSSTIFPPKDWQLFERNIRLLFEYSLNDPHTLNNGRQGQPQHGVDVYGRRGGKNGPLVGIQCKGKDANFGDPVTESELRDEVKKSEGFVPELKEFILVTTAQDDGAIQEKARLLEREVRSQGRDLSISVWGWQRLEQEIIRFPEVLRAFQPDAMPYSDRIFNELSEIKAAVRKQVEPIFVSGSDTSALKPIVTATPLTQIAVDTKPSNDALDKLIDNQIDTYRDFIRDGRPRTAIQLLTRLRDQIWTTASDRVRYRILGNLGAANHRLGEFEVAADFFLQATEFNRDDPTSIANKIAGLLIKGRKGDAHALAIDAIERFPGNPDVWLQRLQARSLHEKVDDVWHQLPVDLRTKADFIFCRAISLRAEGDLEWRTIVEGGLHLHADDTRLKVMRAERVLFDLINDDPSAVGAEGRLVPSQAELLDAASTFETMWNNSLDKEVHLDGAFAHNAALLRYVLRQDGEAAKILDSAFKHGFSSDESKRLRSAIYVRAGNKTDALKTADTLSDTPLARIIRADLRLPEACADARGILSTRSEFAERKDIIAAAMVVTESFLAESNYDAALAEAQRLRLLLPNDPQSALCLYEVKRAQAAADTQQTLTDAAANLNKTSDFVTRFLVADALCKAGRWDEAVDVLYRYTSTHFDSRALRALIAGAVNSDRRSILKHVLDQLPAEIAALFFYRDAAVALALRSGNIRLAEREIRACLVDRPRSLSLHLQLMHIFFREDRIEELKTEVNRPASEFDGDPADFMKLAQFKDDFGDWHEAHDLAYKTLLANQNDPDVNSGYFATFLHPGHSRELDVTPATVAENLAVGIVTEDGVRSTYIIEPDAQLRPSPNYLAPTHHIAERLTGKSIGDGFVLPDGTKAKIDWIKPKVLHALHEILNNFQNLFPDVQGFERVRVPLGEPNAFQSVFARVRQRHDFTERISSLYDGGNVPITLAAKILGIDPIEAFYGLISTGHVIHTCVGTLDEREAAFAAINSNAAKGCVIDAITLQTIYHLGLHDAVTSVCGPISITAGTELQLDRHIYELTQRLDEKEMSMFWRDGQFYRQEHTPERKREELEQLKVQKAWLVANTQTLPAQGTKDPSPDFRNLLRQFGTDLVDDIRAAEGHGLLLISDDQAFRGLAAAEFSVRSSWLQPVLMKAVGSRRLSRKDYLNSVIRFVDCKLDFITLDAELLVETLKNSQPHTLSDGFLKLASRFGGPNADLDSHLSVVFRAIAATWRDSKISWTLRYAAVGKLLEQVTKNRTYDQFIVILQKFFMFDQRVLRDLRFTDYLTGWLRGHFIQIH